MATIDSITPMSANKNSMIYDIIGDIHGCADSLENLLLKLGYKPHGKGYHFHGGESGIARQVIFLGDIIDRGSQVVRSLEIVKTMVDAGDAQMVLGNHEFSAIAYFTQVNDDFLRPHTARSKQQIQKTLDQFSGQSELLGMYLDWFQTLPLFLEFDNFRVVHACWDQKLIDQYQIAFSSHCLSIDRVKECVDSNSLSARVIDRLTRGISLKLPDQQEILGRDGYRRRSFRVNFWSENAETYEDVRFQPDHLPVELKARKLSINEHKKMVHYSTHEKLLFVGHYWLEGKPKPVADNIVCLDYSAVSNGQLVAYSLPGDAQNIDIEAFTSVVVNY